MSKMLGQDLDEVAQQSKIVWNNHRAFSKPKVDFGKIVNWLLVFNSGFVIFQKYIRNQFQTWIC